jgi:uncharacterized membrane protein
MKKVTKTAIIASLYATLTLSLSFMSYATVQFRLSEIMILLAFINKEYILGLTIGCFFANLIGPFGVVDILFGTTATLMSAYLVYATSKVLNKSKLSLIIASFFPTVINSILIGLELNIFFKVPLKLAMLNVAIGEFVVITIIGVPFFIIMTRKYKKFLKA